MSATLTTTAADGISGDIIYPASDAMLPRRDKHLKPRRGAWLGPNHQISAP